jgi:hypothetical protein
MTNEVCYWCGKACQGMCLNLGTSTQMSPSNPAYFMLSDGVTSTPTVHSDSCYICGDPEFAQMGLPLCNACLACGGHVAADDTECDDCGADAYELYMASQEARE